jgi:hypothetical protein
MQLRDIRTARRTGPVSLGLVALFALALGLAAPSSASAQDESRPPGSDPFWERLKFRVSGFSASSSTEIRLDRAEGEEGTELDFEDDLGLDDQDFLPSFDASYRFNRKSRIEASFFSLSRDGTRELSRTIDFGDRTFEIGTEIESHFDTDIFRVSYAFSFVNNPQAEFGFSAGLHVLDVGTGISTLGGTLSVEKDADITAPLPVVGLHGGYAFSPVVSAWGRSQLFSLSIDRYSGTLLDLYGGLQYDFTPNLGIAGGFQYYHVDVDVEGERGEFVGKMNFDYIGPTLSGVVRF